MDLDAAFLINKAEQFAAYHHAAVGQKRKYSGEPYIVHPKAVAVTIQTITNDTAMICAAWLHDTVEDTDATLEDIINHFGPKIGYLVKELTNISKLEDGNRATRKAIDRAHIALISPAAKTIKLADRLDNCKDFEIWDAGFRKLYIAETKLLLEVLKDGNQLLWAKLNTLIKVADKKYK